MKTPSPTMAVAVLALVVATGGTSYAAAKITSKDIKNNSIKSVDIKNKGIKAKDLAPGVVPVVPEGARWVLVNAAGAIEAQSGGFSVTIAYPVLPVNADDPTGLRANGNVYINAGEPLTNNAIIASVALQNQLDQNADMIKNGRNPLPDTNPEFSGEIAATQCMTATTACAPPNTGNVNTFVVSPRNSDGTPTADGERKRFYVVIVGDSTDRIAP